MTAEMATKTAKKVQAPLQGVMKKAAVIRSGFEKDVRKKAGASATPLSFNAGENNLGNGTSIHLFPQIFAGQETSIVEKLQNEVAWQQQKITVMGKKVMQPRLVAYMANDTSLSYTYSQTKQSTLPWTPTVAKIKEKVEEMAQTRFNSCLLNMYRDGKDSLSWHSDNEKPYGPNPTIGSVSFGHARDFLLRKNSDRSQRYAVRLGGAGDVLLMAGNCQKDWQHSVPKRASCRGVRINLTFRTIVDKEL